MSLHLSVEEVKTIKPKQIKDEKGTHQKITD
jgi:hypothetical protein